MPALSCVALLALIGVSSTALAEPIDLSPTGLADPVSTISFSEVDIADSTLVSDQFTALGATFLPNLFLRTGDNADWQNISGPNLRTGEPEVNPFSIKFGEPLTSAAFTSIAQPPTAVTFTAKLNGEVVESFDSNITITDPNNFFGFTGIAFDEIEVNTSNRGTRLRVDNVQLGAAVPAVPVNSLGGLLALGLVVLATGVRFVARRSGS